MLCCAQEDRGKKRLQFLLKQAEVFQHFAPLSQKEAQEKEKKKKRGRHGGYTEEQEDEGACCGSGGLPQNYRLGFT